ncbi:MAG: response regulator [Anaerolineales bacterium]|nr:response regulator [Anaerolineales bacterium]
MADPRILVADDDPMLLQLMARRLAKLGHQAEQAADGHEALSKIDAMDFDLIVTDIYMPEVTGLEILQRARSHDPHVQVVVVTASATLQNAIEALNNGAFGYLNKPFDHLSVFDNAVSRALEYRRLILDNLRMAEAQRKRGDLLEDEVTERVIRLRRRQQETVAILASLPIGVIVLEGFQRTILRNPKAEKFLNMDKDFEHGPLNTFIAEARENSLNLTRTIQLGEEHFLVQSSPLTGMGDVPRILVSIQPDGRKSGEVDAEMQAALAYLKRELMWLSRRPLDLTTLEAVRQMQRQVQLLTAQFINPDQTMLLSEDADEGGGTPGI